MRVGISSFAYTWAVGVEGVRSAEPAGPMELVAMAAEIGADVLQIGDHVPLAELARQDVEALGASARRRGVALEVGARGLTQAALAAHLEVCRTLGATMLRFVVDAPGHEPPAHEVVEVLRAALPDLAAADVTVALENHDRFGVRELAAIVQAVDSPLVGVCLDTVNSFGSGEGPREVLAALAPLTVNVHVKDYTIRRRAHGMGFVIEGARLGDGALPLGEVVEAVTSHGRCGTAVLEQWAPGLPNLEQTVALEAAWARAGLDVLRDALDAHKPNLSHEGAH